MAQAMWIMKNVTPIWAREIFKTKGMLMSQKKSRDEDDKQPIPPGAPDRTPIKDPQPPSKEKTRLGH